MAMPQVVETNAGSGARLSQDPRELVRQAVGLDWHPVRLGEDTVVIRRANAELQKLLGFPDTLTVVSQAVV